MASGVAHAQSDSEPTNKADELRSALAAKQMIFVRETDSDKERSGLLISYTGETLTLLRKDGTKLYIPFAGIEQIQRRDDSVKNGATNGALIMGTWCLLICGQGLDSDDQWLQVVGVNTAIGALIGLLVDWLDEGRTTLYPARTPAGRLSLPAAAPFIVVLF